MDLFFPFVFLKKTYDTAKQTPITIETEPRACIEIENHSTPVMVNRVAWIVCTVAPNDDIRQHGRHTNDHTQVQLIPSHAALV